MTSPATRPRPRARTDGGGDRAPAPGPRESPPLAPAVTFHLLRALHQHVLREVGNLAGEGSQAAPDLTQRLAQAGAQAPQPGRHRRGFENARIRPGKARPAPSDDPAECPRGAAFVPKPHASGSDDTGRGSQATRASGASTDVPFRIETRRPGLGLARGPASRHTVTPAGLRLIPATSRRPARPPSPPPLQ